MALAFISIVQIASICVYVSWHFVLPPALARPAWLGRSQLLLWCCTLPVFHRTVKVWQRQVTKHLWLAWVTHPSWRNWLPAANLWNWTTYCPPISVLDPFRVGCNIYIGRVCPVVALGNFLAIRDPCKGPLFCFADGLPLTRQLLSFTVQSRLWSAGYSSNYSGRSF